MPKIFLRIVRIMRMRVFLYFVEKIPLYSAWPDAGKRQCQLARVGNNLNQLARWVNAHKGHVESVDVLLYLEQLWDACRGGPPCI